MFNAELRTSTPALASAAAFANFSRYVRPGATRIGAAGGTGIRTAAFKNLDGRCAVVIINSGAAAAAVSVKITGATPAAASLFVSDNTHTCEKIASTLTEGTMASSVPGHGIGTFFVPPPAAAAPAS